MEKYKVLFKGIHIGNLVVNEENYIYTANSNIIEEFENQLPIFDLLKEDISAKNIPFFKVRLEKKVQTFETDDYELIPVENIL